jgi:GT2 family glycosyltransferase
MHAYLLSAVKGDPGAFSALMIDREVSGLTAAFIGMRRTVFAEVGGFNQSLPSNFNDVDLSMKVRSFGYRLLWLHGAELYHFESKSRESTVHAWEVDLVRRRWGVQRNDPYIHHSRRLAPRGSDDE